MIVNKLFTCILIHTIPFSFSGVHDNTVHVDRLKPKYCNKERNLKAFMDRISRDGLEYKVNVQKKVLKGIGLWGRYKETFYFHRIEIDQNIVKIVSSYDYRFVRGNFLQYLEDKQYSFYAAIMLMARRAEITGHEGFMTKIKLEPIQQHNKQMWDENIDKYSELIIRPFALHRPWSYYNKILYESIPVKYHEDIFSQEYVDYGSIIRGPRLWDGGLEKKVVSVLSAYKQNGEYPKASVVPLSEEYIDIWVYKVLYSKESDRISNIKCFLSWCEEKGEANGFLAALVMGLFIVDGYSFDATNGHYDINDRGKLFLKYIIHYPIPENASRIKVIMEGGNSEYVSRLMRDCGTLKKWEMFLKKPAEPKYATYKKSRGK